MTVIPNDIVTVIEMRQRTQPEGARSIFPRPYFFFKTDITYNINLRHTRYLKVTRILCIWSWLLLNLGWGDSG